MAGGVGPGLAGAFVAVAGSYLGVRTGRGAGLDRAAHRVLTRRHGPTADRVIGALTDLGSIYALAGVTSALAAGGHRRQAREVAFAGGAAWVGAQVTKPLLQRSRPYELQTGDRLVAIPAGSSWPSGHAALAAAMTDALWDSAGPGTRGAMVLGTSAVAASRCYVGVHHLTDVIGGVGVGVLASRASRWLTRRAAPAVRTR